jgi:hypothetical protein
MDTLESALAVLTDRQRVVVRRRLDGAAYSVIGAELGCTRQAVACCEADACAKLGLRGSIKELVFDEIGACVRQGMRENAALAVHDGLELRDGHCLDKRKLSKLERLQDRLEKLASDILDDDLKGRLTDERRTYYLEASAGLAQALARAERPQ